MHLNFQNYLFRSLIRVFGFFQNSKPIILRNNYVAELQHWASVDEIAPNLGAKTSIKTSFFADFLANVTDLNTCVVYQVLELAFSLIKFLKSKK